MITLSKSIFSRMIKRNINRSISIVLLTGSVFYFIPKTILMLDWLKSGVISGYFYIMAQINILIILMTLFSLLSFKQNVNDIMTNRLMINNIIGLIVMILWFPVVYNS